MLPAAVQVKKSTSHVCYRRFVMLLWLSHQISVLVNSVDVLHLADQFFNKCKVLCLSPERNDWVPEIFVQQLWISLLISGTATEVNSKVLVLSNTTVTPRYQVAGTSPMPSPSSSINASRQLPISSQPHFPSASVHRWKKFGVLLHPPYGFLYYTATAVIDRTLFR